MTTLPFKPAMTERVRSMIETGYKIHQSVVAWGRETGIMAYLVINPDGKSWFETFDRKTKTVSRRLPENLARKIIENRQALKVYVDDLERRSQGSADGEVRHGGLGVPPGVRY